MRHAQLIQTSERVKQYGEVFSPNFLVQKMCDQVDCAAVNLKHTILDPACGTGNFLCEILRRRLNHLRSHTHSGDALAAQLLRAMSTLYGIDILPDNVTSARNNLCKIIRSVIVVENIYLDYRFWPLIKLFLDRNIICADFLRHHDEIIFAEWQRRGDYCYIAHPQTLAKMLREHDTPALRKSSQSCKRKT